MFALLILLMAIPYIYNSMDIDRSNFSGLHFQELINAENVSNS